jgi:hypothetical protein
VLFLPNNAEFPENKVEGFYYFFCYGFYLFKLKRDVPKTGLFYFFYTLSLFWLLENKEVFEEAYWFLLSPKRLPDTVGFVWLLNKPPLNLI